MKNNPPEHRPREAHCWWNLQMMLFPNLGRNRYSKFDPGKKNYTQKISHYIIIITVQLFPNLGRNRHLKLDPGIKKIILENFQNC